MMNFQFPTETILFVTLGIILLIFVFGLFDQKKTSRLPKKLQRSNNYRTIYFKRHKGLFGKGIFFCPFCGKLMWKKDKIQIDHIQSIHRVQNSVVLREYFKKLPDGVNDIKNLVHACPTCNLRKGSKGGVWVILGHCGQYFMPIIRYTVIAALTYLVCTAIFLGGWRI